MDIFSSQVDIFTQMKQRAEEEAARRRRAMRLKNLIPEKVVEQMDTAERMDILNRSLDVYGMVLNGIDIVNNVSDAVQAWNGVRAVAQEGELGMTTLKESARLTQLTNTMKVTDSIIKRYSLRRASFSFTRSYSATMRCASFSKC